MNVTDIIIIVVVVIAVIFAALYFLNRWASSKSVDQQSIIDKTKMTVSIYIIDKRKDKMKNVNLPKAVMDNVPKWSGFMNHHFVKAKVGPQILTLMSDKKAYKFMEAKKTYKVDLAGIYIVSVKGMKSDFERKEAAKEKKAKAKLEKQSKK